ncbi:MAG: secondary thiamine-phosphate synthase enzyme YjbQ [Nanoarchaeota archaeon]|nr:secondary thiamine-phosphate synthase enzyme YjbQ [Nanoarchaeota archaeon]
MNIKTKGKYEVVDITSEVEEQVKHLDEGIVIVYTPHATGAIILNENYDPNIGKDIVEALDKIIPEGKWMHDAVDDNGAAHIKAAIIGPSETVIVKEGKLQLGTWQNICFCDFDGPRERTIYVKVIKG